MHEPVYRSPRRRTGRQSEQKTAEAMPKSFYQLIICIVVLGAVLLIKTLSPSGGEAIRAMVNERITVGIDAEEALAAIGKTLNGEQSFTEAFLRLTGVRSEEDPLSGPDSKGADGETDSSPAPTPEITPADVSAKTNNDSGGEKPRLFPEENIFVPPPLKIDELMVTLSEEDTEDDTLPIPFGTVVPDKASFSKVELPFDYVIPVNGEVTSSFGYRDSPIDGEENTFHFGLDISGASGTNVKCFADGKVAASGLSKTYGNYVIIEHAGGFSTLYAHCQKIIAREGKTVKAGDIIAKVGATGRVTGPHLHFEVRDGNTLLNPQLYLNITVR